MSPRSVFAYSHMEVFSILQIFWKKPDVLNIKVNSCNLYFNFNYYSRYQAFKGK